MIYIYQSLLTTGYDFSSKQCNFNFKKIFSESQDHIFVSNCFLHLLIIVQKKTLNILQKCEPV